MNQSKKERDETIAREKLIQGINNLLKNSEIDFNKKWPAKQVIWNLSCPEPFNSVKIPSSIQKEYQTSLSSFYPPKPKQVHQTIDTEPVTHKDNVFSMLDKI